MPTTVPWPVARFLRGHRWPPSLAAVTVVVPSLANLVGVVLLVDPPLAQEPGAVVDGFAAGLQKVQQWLTGPPLNLGEDQVGQAVGRAINIPQNHVQDVAGVVVFALTSVG